MIRQYRKQWLKWHDGYERSARVIFQRAFKDIAKDIPFERMTVGTYKSYMQTHVSKEKIFDSYVKVYSEVGTKHGKRVGVQINKQINEKNFTVDGFLNEFQKTLIKFLVTNEGSRITSVRQSYIKYLTQIMSKGIEEGKTISIIATDMKKLIKSRNFYRWQALRIARTETTAASNYAATVSSSVSGVLMDKVWISALDERTRQGRFNHLVMNQKRVHLDKPFNVSGQKLMFPGDPNGSAGNVINCRCSVAQVVRRDSDGNIMRIEDVGAPIPNIGVNTNVFRAARTLEEAENFAKSQGVKNVNYKDISLKNANSLNEGIFEIKNKIPETIKDVSIDNSRIGYAKANFAKRNNTINISKTVSADDEITKQYMKQTYDKITDQKWSHGTSYKNTIIHEYGHAREWRLFKELKSLKLNRYDEDRAFDMYYDRRREIFNKYDKTTAYGSTEADEMIAEAFAEIILYGEKAGEYAKEIEKLYNDIIKKYKIKL